MYRIGQGYDVHRLESGYKLILGGVEIPYPKGLKGHSDADVLVHAIMDAIIGALALGDIGKLFPDTDPAYKGADSLQLLKSVMSIDKLNGWGIVNVDSTIITQKPRISGYIEQMRKNIAATLECDIDKISVKATTTEKLGFCGREEGMAAWAVIMLGKNNA